jgi:hypothetical protein
MELSDSIPMEQFLSVSYEPKGRQGKIPKKFLSLEIPLAIL